MNSIKYFFISLLFLLSFSCNKETVRTSGDEIMTELEKIIKDNNTKRIIAWDDKSGFPTNISTTLGTSWSFSNAFITINGYGGTPDSYSRNLLFLDKYEIGTVLLSDGTNSAALILHFQN